MLIDLNPQQSHLKPRITTSMAGSGFVPMTVRNSELRRRHNASDLAMIILAMVAGGMLTYVLIRFVDLPVTRGIGIMFAPIVVVGISLGIFGGLKLFRSLY